jgi:hypothetical protein
VSAGWRRLLPPPRHRPGLVAIIVRWRIEIALLALVWASWRSTGPLVMAFVFLGSVLAAATMPTVRHLLVRVWQLLVVPHRVRTALVQAGVGDRAGRLPWILWAESAGRSVRVEVQLRAGIVVDDLVGASSVIAGACGASEVAVLPHPYRANRAALEVGCPMWGVLCRS